MHYVVTPDGNVRTYRQKSIATAMKAQLGEGAGIAVVTGDKEELGELSTAVLVTLHNIARPEKPVTRFADRSTAEKRVKGVLELLGKPGEAPVSFEGEKDEGEGAGTSGASSAEEEMVEVEDDSPLTPEEFTPDPSKSEEENEAMAAKARSARPKKSVKKSAAKKGAKRAARAEANPITDATVRKVIKMRADGKGWPEILKELGEKSNNFIHRIRPLMKKMDKSSVMAIGPGSPNYGKMKGKKGAKKAK